ncbi:hypothetical protein FisN_26Lh104 [Fistulifera solaris]|uniref:ShKT domain-containing protein n=1 Tax=Fistulifera solaris TaxID=1519565 RepID=A0A1Z5KCL0_FISSO|nr:hypothetical protein FisN_26Lh104 [Fistulifera solaris]|eukprot:GAX24034.1 hypothetical protein FisN_26Lh104 [Fistulifera solaris]
MNPTTTRAPTAPLMPISIGLPDGPTTPTAIPVSIPAPVPVRTQAPSASPLATTSAPILSTASPTMRRIPEETQSPTMNPTTTRAPSVGLEPIPVDLPTITRPRTRAPTDFQPVLIAPIPYHRVPTQPPTECQDTGDCDILLNFPYLHDFLCFDEEFGIADECALSCGVCGGDVSPLRAYCVDDKSAFFFINDAYGYQSCKWLSMKAALQQELCAAGKDGYKHCPRVCGRCNAVCQDDPGAAIFINYEIGYETCAWLANNQSYQATACKGEFAAKSCPKTCGICSLAKKSAQTIIMP